jgi:hypothetical protein
MMFNYQWRNIMVRLRCFNPATEIGSMFVDADVESVIKELEKRGWEKKGNKY